VDVSRQVFNSCHYGYHEEKFQAEIMKPALLRSCR